MVTSASGECIDQYRITDASVSALQHLCPGVREVHSVSTHNLHTVLNVVYLLVVIVSWLGHFGSFLVFCWEWV